LSRPGRFSYYPADTWKKTLYKEMLGSSRNVVVRLTGSPAISMRAKFAAAYGVSTPVDMA
jgi:hypothetical protein